MAKKVENEETQIPQVASESTDNEAKKSSFDRREFFKKRAQKQANEIQSFLGRNRFNFESQRFINKAYTLYQNISQINDVAVIVGNDFTQEASRELMRISNLENKMIQDINSNKKLEEIQKIFQALDESKKLKVEAIDKLKELGILLETQSAKTQII